MSGVLVMSRSHPISLGALELAQERTAAKVFHPTAAIRNVGQLKFRTQASRDFACLLDFDADVASWICIPAELPTPQGFHVPDLLVCHEDGTGWFVDVSEDDLSHVTIAASSLNLVHRVVSPASFVTSLRLINARDLLRYGRYRTPLGDRVRILAALEECSSLTVAEAFNIFREIQPMAGIASLVLGRHIAIDMDDELIGPQTMLRPFASRSSR
ncbi:hypothetical protein C8J34_10829 [Rhizobium sp. PP-F2F-G36]|nr:hypothetical protein C8J34_10829 [Rhizobium sp. PP-F2F-G36]